MLRYRQKLGDASVRSRARPILTGVKFSLLDSDEPCTGSYINGSIML